ncbi:hypothetical protein HYH03_013000 [Edaphochlamys debaryana]|uniref:EF-hand domain-containing protein n=1 Tax=Edaphochlamys debaryana TaxID=47281 RepID=A0A835XRW6_9CHLO|nr:hypothetical protein HYH03_013000 [Edaphochlamys debaryana]|eukprot:KAG2488497.1 hypothetical protein HYH03_013000 [Edaphochlamys debaryana]
MSLGLRSAFLQRPGVSRWQAAPGVAESQLVPRQHGPSAPTLAARRRSDRCSVLARSASRDDVEEVPRSGVAQRADDSRVEAPEPAVTHRPSAAEGLATPFAFSTAKRLPNLACDPRNPGACVSVASIEDPRLDPSHARTVREYMEQLVESGMSEQRAAAVIAHWSAGGGISGVDLTKLRLHFLASTLLPVLKERLPQALTDVALASALFWSLSLLPAADDSLLHPSLRGALVALNLLALVATASKGLRTVGRVFRIGGAAVTFSQHAELVLLALQALADGHGRLIRAARGSPAAATLAEVEPDRVLGAAAAAMRHARRQAVSASSPSSTPTSAPSSSEPSTRARSASALSSLDSMLVLQQAAAGGAGRGSAAASFDAVGELGLSSAEAADAAAMYARYGDSMRGGRMGEYELRKLLQEAGYARLSPAELSLALLLVDPDRKGWLSFRDWAVWWAAEAERERAEAEGRGPGVGVAAALGGVAVGVVAEEPEEGVLAVGAVGRGSRA